MVLQALNPRPSKAGADAQVVGQSHVTVDDSILGLEGSPVDKALDGMLYWVNQEYGEQLIVKAKDDFYWRNGKVFHEDDFYPSRMTYFVDQFLFHYIPERESGSTLTLFDLYREEHPLSAIKSVRHSIFRVRSLGKEKLKIIDLLSNKQLVVKRRQNETFFGIKRKQILQGHVYSCGDEMFLSLGLVFHPSACTKQILRYIADVQSAGRYDPAAVLARFARLQLRHKRHAHVDPTVIYQTDAR